MGGGDEKKEEKFSSFILQAFIHENTCISETIPYAAGTRPFGQPLMFSRALPENGDIPSKQSSKSSNFGGGLGNFFKKH